MFIAGFSNEASSLNAPDLCDGCLYPFSSREGKFLGHPRPVTSTGTCGRGLCWSPSLTQRGSRVASYVWTQLLSGQT